VNDLNKIRVMPFGFLSIRRCVFLITFCVMPLMGSAQRLPDPPPNQRPGATGSSLNRTPEPPGAWERIQPSLDRSTGRIPGEPTHTVEQLQRRQDERSGVVIPQADAQRWAEERDRQLRVDQQKRLDAAKTQRERREELDRREYELFINRGFSPLSRQAQADETALMRAQTERDEHINRASVARAEARAASPDERTTIEDIYLKRVREIRGEYEIKRAMILGVALDYSQTDNIVPPATRPAE
jgi:hypothetical protein